MVESTVTMSLGEYDALQRKVNDLRNETELTSLLGIRRECLDCGTKGRTKMQQEIITCPECKGLYVDVHVKNSVKKILHKAGYKKC